MRKRLSVLAAALLATSAVPAAASAASLFGSNLIVNGDAEAGVGSPSGAEVPAPGFTTTGAFTVVSYGGPGFPAPDSPGGSVGGHNFFAGGAGASVSTGSQFIDLTAGADFIDLGTTTFELSAYLGGYASQADNAALSVAFVDGAGAALGAPIVLAPVSNLDRGDVTGLILRRREGFVPSGARGALLTLTMNRVASLYNDGYADNLSLILAAGEPPAAVPEPATWAMLLAGFAGAGASFRRRRALNVRA
jgi:hypothetical protein